MAEGKKISEMTALSTIAGTEVIPCVSGSDNRTLLVSQIVASANAYTDTVVGDISTALDSLNTLIGVTS